MRHKAKEMTPDINALLRDVIQQHSDRDNAFYNHCEYKPCQWCVDAKAFLAADMVAVPREPTEAMMAVDAPPDEFRGDEPVVRTYRRGIWKAMIVAAEKGE